jgi:hypothetical protein
VLVAEADVVFISMETRRRGERLKPELDRGILREALRKQLARMTREFIALEYAARARSPADRDHLSSERRE